MSGCLDLKASYPDRRFYTLEATRSGTTRVAPLGSILRVRRFAVSRLCEGSELVTRSGEALYDSDYYHVFFFPPALQVTEQTQRWLGASSLFEHVVGTGSSIPETHVLEGNLIALHGDQRRPQASLAVLEAQFMLVNVSVDPSAVLFQKAYRRELAISKDGPESLVRGWNDGLSGILMALEEDLSKVDRTPAK
jgi:hypothetical protein